MIANLKYLNDLQKEADELFRKAKRIEEQAQYLATRRKNMVVLSQYIMEIRPHQNEYLSEIEKEVLRVVNSISNDVFRTVEMNFISNARELRIGAKLKQQQISNFFPEVEELEK